MKKTLVWPYDEPYLKKDCEKSENNEYLCPEYILCTCIILYLEFLAPHDAPLGHSHQIQTKLEKKDETNKNIEMNCK